MAEKKEMSDAEGIVTCGYIVFSYVTFPFWYWAASRLSQEPTAYSDAANAVMLWIFAPVSNLFMMGATLLNAMYCLMDYIT